MSPYNWVILSLTQPKVANQQQKKVSYAHVDPEKITQEVDVNTH